MLKNSILQFYSHYIKKKGEKKKKKHKIGDVARKKEKGSNLLKVEHLLKRIIVINPSSCAVR